MASYAKLTLGSLEIGASRNDIDPGLMWLFRPADKRTQSIDRRDRQKLAEYVEVDFIEEYDESNPFTIVEYQCTVSAARDRLDLKGFTYAIAEEVFKKELEAEIKHDERFLASMSNPQVTKFIEDELRILRSLTPESWRKALSRIKDERLTEEALSALPPNDNQLPLLRHMVKKSSDFYGFPGSDYRHAVRMALEESFPQDLVVYDLSDLIASGWLEQADDVVAVAEYHMDEGFLLYQRVIVLTEGDVDRQILQRSLKILYPHLADYFHFFDFTGRKVAGGVGELKNLVQAFAAADVRHRMLALFDNDTAAKAALSNLDLDGLPSNIAVYHYPSLPLAMSYPTLGPSGMALMNVNGLAGSIELYLGEDVLRGDGGVLSPVQWTGYERKAQAYQGAILDKQGVLERFESKLADCENHPDHIGLYDWEGIHSIIGIMRTAFHLTDAQSILSDIEQRL